MSEMIEEARIVLTLAEKQQADKEKAGHEQWVATSLRKGAGQARK